MGPVNEDDKTNYSKPRREDPILCDTCMIMFVSAHLQMAVSAARFSPAVIRRIITLSSIMISEWPALSYNRLGNAFYGIGAMYSLKKFSFEKTSP